MNNDNDVLQRMRERAMAEFDGNNGEPTRIGDLPPGTEKAPGFKELVALHKAVQGTDYVLAAALIGVDNDGESHTVVYGRSAELCAAVGVLLAHITKNEPIGVVEQVLKAICEVTIALKRQGK